MKIKCTKANLLSALNIVSKAVSTKTTMPILECVLIEAYSDSIKLTANDLEIGIETILEGEVIEMGRIAIEAKRFIDIVRKQSDSDIYIESTPDFNTIIRCERFNSSNPSKSGEEFTELPTIEKNKCVTISQFTLREIIKQTIFAISDTASNKLMTGEYFEISGGKLKVVALDGHRISLRNVEVKTDADNIKAVVPGKTLNDISKIITGGVDDMVNIYFSERHILFEFDNTVVVSRLIEGDFFNISTMFNVDTQTKVIANTSEFYNCIDRVSLYIRENEKKPLIIDVKNNMTYLKVPGGQSGSADEEIEVKKTGNDIIIGFNPKFVMDVLRVIDDEEVEMHMENSKRPLVIKNETEDYIYVILPVNINVGAN